MKPSQFKKIEKQAYQQRSEIILNIEKAKRLNMNIVVEKEEENLKNLVSTMKNLHRTI